jgi:hypothetical protein
MLKLKQGIISESGLYTCKWTITAGAPTATLNVRVMGSFLVVFSVFLSLSKTLFLFCFTTNKQPWGVPLPFAILEKKYPLAYCKCNYFLIMRLLEE